MRAISKPELQNCLGLGSTKLLHNYQSGLRRDCDEVIHDYQAIGVVERYSKMPTTLKSELRYLRFLKDKDGLSFCRSIKRYADMEAQWEFFLKPDKASFLWNEHCQKAVERVKKRYLSLLTHRLKPLIYRTDNDIRQAVTDWSTSAGWERIVRPAKSKDAVFKRGNILKAWKKEISKALKNGSFNKPILCAVRTQGSGAYDDEGQRTNTCKHKTRAVNMVDIWVIITESVWAKPFNELVKSYSFSAIGKNDRDVSRWVFQRRRKAKSWVSFDYSKYDSTIPAWLIKVAFEVIRSCFSDSEYDGLWDVIVEDFIHKNIVTGKGVIHVDHGNPSGSRFTSIINGICNEIITETWLDMFGRTGDYMIMGDDNLVYLDVAVAPDEINSICSYISHNFGIQTNANKTKFGSSHDDPLFMSRYWRIDGPDRSIGEVISLLMYPEGKRPYFKKEIGLKPEHVVFSYILCYPIAMRKLMDVDRFLRDTNLSIQDIPRTKEALRELPYSMRTYIEMTYGVAA